MKTTEINPTHFQNLGKNIVESRHGSIDNLIKLITSMKKDKINLSTFQDMYFKLTNETLGPYYDNIINHSIKFTYSRNITLKKQMKTHIPDSIVKAISLCESYIYITAFVSNVKTMDIISYSIENDKLYFIFKNNPYTSPQ
jgi:hypothetical protein